MSRTNAFLLVALSLGLAWAIRGHFGHEWGACWAGAIGTLAVVVASRRRDWIQKLPALAAVGGIGWGVGGMMSYGILVGQGHADAAGTVAYGLAMLFVVGGLYGMIGGGLFGLAIESTEDHRPDWATLLTQMIAGGILAWGILIYQFEWYMTPPRSELWAACFGAAAAMLWYCQRHGFRGALRVACYAALGAGFGFAFGDFLQMLGNVSQWPFNWWNVMEFTLGCCGGIGLAYGVLTHPWPASAPSSRSTNVVALVFSLLAVPATNLLHGFETQRLVDMAHGLSQADPAAFALTLQFVAWGLILLFLLLGIGVWRWTTDSQPSRFQTGAAIFLMGYTLLYLLFSHLVKGVFFIPMTQQLEQKLYWVVYLGIAILTVAQSISRHDLSGSTEHRETPLRWMLIALCLMVALVTMTWLTVYLKAAVSV